ncbi:MAG TPA: TonB-dependent receptor [Ignavibacteriales bacterium]|nr:TonB-dependent receptor [Ignavibacteriales bacterium]
MFKRLLIILLFTGTYIFSQGQKSKIYGKVVDDLTGEVIIGATVKIEGTKLGAVTDAKGKYVIINVQPGTYNLVVTSIGYAKTTIKEIEAVVDRSVEVNIRLKQQTMQMQAVEVTAEREKIIKDQTSTSSTITQEQIKAAPVEGVRGIIDLSTSFQKNERGDYQVRGSGTNEVNFQINGMEQTNSSQSLPGLGTGTKANNSWKYDVNPLGVQQIQMITGGFSPEYGNAQAAIIKVVMKEGALNLMVK